MKKNNSRAKASELLALSRAIPRMESRLSAMKTRYADLAGLDVVQVFRGIDYGARAHQIVKR